MTTSSASPMPVSSQTPAVGPEPLQDVCNPRVAVVIASAGRPELLGATLGSWTRQRGVAYSGSICVPDAASLPDDPEVLGPAWTISTGVRGAAAQRNHATSAVDPNTEYVAFFDDDAVVRHDYLAEAVRFLDDHPQVLAITGRVLLDGASGDEVPRELAEDILDQSLGRPVQRSWRFTRELYGCNMVIRLASFNALRFDERLPLYSWLEDHDLARRLMGRGRLAKLDACVVVHLGFRSGGRQSHFRLGYSQVMNPAYLMGKGSFPLWLALEQVLRPMAKNAVLALAGGESPWRRRRLKGNFLACADLLRARVTPERILDLEEDL